MALLQLVATTLTCLLSTNLGVRGQVLKEGRGVCSKQTLRVPLIYNETFIQPVYHPFLTTCKGLRTCSTYRTTYRVSYRQVTKEVLQTSITCCPGWQKNHPGATSCDQDVDECRTPIHSCFQQCVNTLGSYHCACHPGFSLGADEKSCQEQPTPSPALPTSGQSSSSEELTNEVKELQGKMADLQERLEWTVNTFQNLLPMRLEDIKAEHIQELWTRLRQLDQVESLSDQLMYMEEKMGSCACQDNKISLRMDPNTR
ncbi:epidermal growth factor-like protein 8 isoform X2 [Microcaecilia unicolor]|uniref:Epidermal growth factor-like protein 8 isoform X2 n=1 Tax=Microcaecilia unicolor TaxID=1415580 RepID=A0A6P7X6F2_9AMPH|nr:epidermal growth factor-like protein 8 isoform X2 [Microcaecilia unicolor]